MTLLCRDVNITYILPMVLSPAPTRLSPRVSWVATGSNLTNYILPMVLSPAPTRLSPRVSWVATGSNLPKEYILVIERTASRIEYTRVALGCSVHSRLCGRSYLIKFLIRNLSYSPCSEPSRTVLFSDVMFTMYARHPYPHGRFLPVCKSDL